MDDVLTYVRKTNIPIIFESSGNQCLRHNHVQADMLWRHSRCWRHKYFRNGFVNGAYINRISSLLRFFRLYVGLVLFQVVQFERKYCSIRMNLNNFYLFANKQCIDHLSLSSPSNSIWLKQAPANPRNMYVFQKLIKLWLSFVKRSIIWRVIIRKQLYNNYFTSLINRTAILIGSLLHIKKA